MRYILLLLALTANLYADALRSPPNLVRSWLVTATDTTQNVTLPFNNPTYTVTRTTRSLLIDNADSTDDVTINVSASSIPTDTQGGNNVRVRAGHTMQFDGEFYVVSYIRAGAGDVTPLYIIVSY
jgi:hypothetical protein